MWVSVMLDDCVQEQEAFTETLADMSMDDKINIGFQQEEFILDCQFSGYDCSSPKLVVT